MERTETSFSMGWKDFPEPISRPLEDEFFGKWLNDPVSVGAFENEELLGFAEGYLEEWNNRFRLTNICVFDKENRKRGIGKELMKRMEQIARSQNARMMVLETQSFNYPAISFYSSSGFEIIGFDLYAYGNNGPEEQNVRIEMGKKLR